MASNDVGTETEVGKYTCSCSLVWLAIIAPAEAVEEMRLGSQSQ